LARTRSSSMIRTRGMGLFLPWPLVGGRFEREIRTLIDGQRDSEPSAAAIRTVQLNIAGMEPGDAFHSRQTDTGSGRLGGVEEVEDPGSGGGRNAGAVVLDDETCAAVAVGRAAANADTAAGASVLHRIGDEFDDDLLELSAIAEHGDVVVGEFDVDVQAKAVDLRTQLADSGGGDLGERNRCERGGVGAGEIQKAGGAVAQPASLGENILKARSGVRGQGVVFEHELSRAAD